MGTAAATKGVRGAKATPWAAALEKGVEGWSSFTETGSGEDIRTEDGSREVGTARGFAQAPRRQRGRPAADGPVAARSGDDAKSADAKSGGGTGAAAASGADGKAPSGGGATVAAKRDAKDPAAGAGKRPALDQGWRQYRRDVEWQCRWLELRMVEIDGHVDRYQRMLDGIERAKRRGGDAVDDGRSGEKMTTTSGEPETTALTDGIATRMKRRRQHQGDTPPPNPVLGTHPAPRRRRRRVWFRRGADERETGEAHRRAEEAAQEGGGRAGCPRGQVGQQERKRHRERQRPLHRRALRAD